MLRAIFTTREDAKQLQLFQISSNKAPRTPQLDVKLQQSPLTITLQPAAENQTSAKSDPLCSSSDGICLSIAIGSDYATERSDLRL